MAGVPLIVFTADRPPELQDCHAEQTINQKGIFGKFARMYSEVNSFKRISASPCQTNRRGIPAVPMCRWAGAFEPSLPRAVIAVIK